MLNKSIYYLLFLFFLFSCKPDKEEDETVPSNIINDSLFTKVLTDFYLCEGAMGINIKNAPDIKHDSIYRFNPLKENHITRAMFDSSLFYYTSHPKKLKLIQERVLENLSQMFSEGKIVTTGIIKKDSILHSSDSTAKK